LLTDIPLLGKTLNIKIDDGTKDYLVRFLTSLPEALSDFRQDDLKAVEGMLEVLREKQLVSSALEKKIDGISDQNYSKNFVSFFARRDQPEKNEEKLEEKPQNGERSEKRRNSARAIMSDWEAAAFLERQKRWENRETQNERNRVQESEREQVRLARIKHDQEALYKKLSEFDDSDWIIKSIRGECTDLECGGYTFYSDRNGWRDRRKRERGREIENDRKDEEREKELLERRKFIESKVIAQNAESQREYHEFLGDKGEKIDTNVQPSIRLGFGTISSSHTSEKRTRPTAVDLEPSSKYPRRPLVPIDYSLEDLLSAGYSNTEAETKLRLIRKEKIGKLIEKIPSDKEGLWNWPVEWRLLNMAKLEEYLSKRVSVEFPREYSKKMVEKVVEIIDKTKDAVKVVEYLRGFVVDEAELFCSRLWRWIVYETEAVAYNLN